MKKKKPKKVIKKYVVGRHIEGEAYDLEDCPMFDTLGEAVTDLFQRATTCGRSNDFNFLQLLVVDTDGDGNCDHYESILSGELADHLVATSWVSIDEFNT